MSFLICLIFYAISSSPQFSCFLGLSLFFLFFILLLWTFPNFTVSLSPYPGIPDLLCSFMLYILHRKHAVGQQRLANSRVRIATPACCDPHSHSQLAHHGQELSTSLSQQRVRIVVAESY